MAACSSWGFAVVLGLLHLAQAAFVTSEVHAFYYLWYGNPKNDGTYLHWNHEILPHWNENIRKQFPSGVRYSPPQHIHAPFYPKRGCYSVRDKGVLAEQMSEIRSTGVNVIVVSWWGQPTNPNTTDTQGVNTDDVIPGLMEVAAKVGIKVAFHLEPYPGRTALSVRADVVYLLDKYKDAPALYRKYGKPLFYVYDAYHVSSEEWAEVLSQQGHHTIRQTPYDSLFIGLWLSQNQGGPTDILRGRWDGFYTYFASTGFTQGSSTTNWHHMTLWAEQHAKIFIASVGPGYNDERIRPWNSRSTRSREGGSYYDSMWEAALKAKADMVSITSYNEWGEGTQIEPAVPRRAVADGRHSEYTYRDYAPHRPDYYLTRTRHWVQRFFDSVLRTRRLYARVPAGVSLGGSESSCVAGVCDSDVLDFQAPAAAAADGSSDETAGGAIEGKARPNRDEL